MKKLPFDFLFLNFSSSEAWLWCIYNVFGMLCIFLSSYFPLKSYYNIFDLAAGRSPQSLPAFSNHPKYFFPPAVFFFFSTLNWMSVVCFVCFLFCGFIIIFLRSFLARPAEWFSHHNKRRALSTIRYYNTTQFWSSTIKDLTWQTSASALSHAVCIYIPRETIELNTRPRWNRFARYL